MKLEKPEIKVPDFVNDLYMDLRDRRLLPLVALLVVAIVAAPFILKDSQPELSPTVGQTGIVAEPGTAPSQLMVVADDAGLRDYKRRLGDLKAKDPFLAKFKVPKVVAKGTEVSTPDSASTSTTTTSIQGSSTGVVSTSTTDTTITPTGPSADTGTPPVPDKPPEVQVETKYVSYEINANVGKPGDVHLRKGIQELTMLPNEKHPVALFMGVTDNAKKALFLVSNDVTSVFGDVGCGFGDDTCQLLELEPGFPVQFTLGNSKQRYQIAVTKIVKVVQSQDEIAGKTAPAKRALADIAPAG